MTCQHIHVKLTTLGNIQCLDCDKWFWRNSVQGKQLKKTISNTAFLDPQQKTILQSLQDSYREVAQLAGTTDPDGIQAYLERRHGG